MNIVVDKNGSDQVYKQIVSEIKRHIHSGKVSPGDPIESIRVLADDLGVAPATVKRAYDVLEKERYIETIPGKGSFVCNKRRNEDSERPKWIAFFSYAHKDNDLTNGRILDLAQDIKNTYELRTGEQIDLFTDEQIEWGSYWQDEINQRLNITAYFIPILTPNYMNSVNCLKELKTVISHAEQIGKKRLVYPIRYVDIDKILEKTSDDELVNFIDSVQRKNWDELHYADRNSSEYRLAVKAIVDDLIDRDDEMPSAAGSGAANNIDTLNNDDDLGTLDKMVEMEEAFESIQTVLDGLQGSLTEISTVANAGTQEIEESDQGNKGFSGRLLVIKKMAKGFEDISENLYIQCGEFTKEFQRIDRGINAIIPQAYLEVQRGETEVDQIKTFYTQVRGFYESSDDAFVAVEGLTENLQPAMKASRDLRKPLSKISRALTDLASNRNAIDGWLMLMNKYDIEKI